MSLSRQLRIIVDIAKASNTDSTVKKIKGELDKIGSAAKDTSSQLSDLSRKTKENSKVYSSFAKHLLAIAENVKKIDLSNLTPSGKINEINTVIGKMVEGIRQAKKELSNFPREGIDSMNAGLSKAGIYLASLSSELSALPLGSLYSLTSILEQASLQFTKLGRESNQTFQAIDKLGMSIRKIQAIGEMKGTSLFSQDISSIQVFQKELEKLRIKLADVMGEGFKSSGLGVSSDMVNQFTKYNVPSEPMAIDAPCETPK